MSILFYTSDVCNRSWEKQQHSLKGKNGTMAMMKRFKDLNLPSPRKDFSHARLTHKKKTEDLSTYELKMGFSR